MNEITIFLTQLWGPVLVAIGLGFMLGREYYASVYQTVVSEKLSFFLAGILALIGGIVHVATHTIWGALPASIITVLGWLLLLKGVAIIVIPQVGQKWAKRFATLPYFMPIGVALVLFGGYLSFVGYF